MLTLSQVRNRVNALKRKLALELQILRLHRIAEDFSLRWVCAVGDHEPLPETHPFILLIADNGFRFHTFMDLHRYLERCRDTGDTPDCWGIIRSLYANTSVDLDRLSQMVENCHNLAAPDEDPEAFEERRPGPHHRDCIYWADRALRRYASYATAPRPKVGPTAAAAPHPEAHLTSRAFRRRQNRQAKNPPSPRGRGAGGEGNPPPRGKGAGGVRAAPHSSRKTGRG